MHVSVSRMVQYVVNIHVASFCHSLWLIRLILAGYCCWITIDYISKWLFFVINAECDMGMVMSRSSWPISQLTTWYIMSDHTWVVMRRCWRYRAVCYFYASSTHRFLGLFSRFMAPMSARWAARFRTTWHHWCVQSSEVSWQKRLSFDGSVSRPLLADNGWRELITDEVDEVDDVSWRPEDEWPEWPDQFLSDQWCGSGITVFEVS